MNDNPFEDPSVSASSSGMPAPDWLENDDETELVMGSNFSSFPAGPMEAMDDPLNPLAADASANPFEASPPSGGSGAPPAAAAHRSDFAAAAAHGATAVAVAGQGVEKLTFAIKDISSAPLPRLVTYMRWANVCVASLMVASALLTILASAASLATVVIAVYVTCFGCLLCTFESHLSLFAAVIAENFGFMYSARGRFGFLVLLSTLCFTLNLIGKITGLLLVLAACLNLYTIVKFPEYASLTLAHDANVSVEEAAGALGAGVVGATLGYAQANPEAAAAALQSTAKWASENPETASKMHSAWSSGAAGPDKV